jgi:hypothetical protein
MAGVVALLFAPAVGAETFKGKLDMVEVRPEGTRFFVQGEKLNLFATGAYQDVLLAGYFRKATFTIDYRFFPCGGGMSGKCGTVHGVSVEREGFQ